MANTKDTKGLKGLMQGSLELYDVINVDVEQSRRTDKDTHKDIMLMVYFGDGTTFNITLSTPEEQVSAVLHGLKQHRTI